MPFTKGGKNAKAKRPKESGRHGKAARKAERDKKRGTAGVATPSPDTKRRKTQEEILSEGKVPLNEEYLRIYCFVCYQFRFDEPPESEWGTHASTIRKEVGCSINTVKRVFKEVRDGNLEKAIKRKEGSGAKRKLEANNPGLIAAALALNVGVPPNLATEICNAKNVTAGLKDNKGDPLVVCRNTLMDTLSSYTDVQKCAILRRKTGSKDPLSDWAKARLVFTNQLKHQFELGDRIDAGEITAESDECDITPLWIDGILQVDQGHTKCTISGAGHSGSCQTQYRIAVDETTMELKPISKGGKVPRRRERVQPKYDKECRGVYGCACPINKTTGESEAQMMVTMDYSEKKMLSGKESDKVIKAIAEKYRGQKIGEVYQGWSGKDAKEWRKYKQYLNPFKARYKHKKNHLGVPKWEEELKKTPSWNPYCDVRDMVRHVISEGNRIFANSRHRDTWMIYHDHLSILWEGETVEWLKTLKCPTNEQPTRTWYDRFIKLEGKWNDNGLVNKRYKNSLPGDSPELMALDNHLFADIKEAHARNIALSFHLPEGHPNKYSASTPRRIYESLERTIHNDVPRPERIVEDMHRIKNETLDRIIEAQGCFIYDQSPERTRKGNRADSQRFDRHVKHEEAFSLLDKELIKAMGSLHSNITTGKEKLPFKLEVPDKKLKPSDTVIIEKDDNNNEGSDKGDNN